MKHASWPGGHQFGAGLLDFADKSCILPGDAPHDTVLREVAGRSQAYRRLVPVLWQARVN